VATLVIGAKYDTMDPAHKEMMSKRMRQRDVISIVPMGVTSHFMMIKRPTSTDSSNSSRILMEACSNPVRGATTRGVKGTS